MLAHALDELGRHIGMFTPDGSAVLLHARTDSLTWFAHQLARQPYDFEILYPPELCSALAQQAARLQRLAVQTDR